ncbi:MAG: hypothetical protein ACI8RD_013340 [Bacillariaceae sp.]|jgi:hypothetical protein
MIIVPNDETADLQREEVQALEAIFPDALELQSGRDDEESFDFPIVYRIKLNEMENDCNDGTVKSCCGNGGTTNWPKLPLSIKIRYPTNYPSEDDHDETENEEAIIATNTVPHFNLLHENTIIDFPSEISEKLLTLLHDTAMNERGMPCILSCLYAARDFLDGDREWDDKNNSSTKYNDDNVANASAVEVTTDKDNNENKRDKTNDNSSPTIKYVCISTHHLLDHKPDNLLRTGNKFNLSGFYKFGTPGVAIAWGDTDNVDDFLDTLKRAMPQKKFEIVFIRTWKEEKHEEDEEDDDQNGTPKGWKNVDPPTLKKELDMIDGVPNEDYYTILGIEMRKDQKDNKCTTENQKGKSNSKAKGKGKGKKK